MNKLKQHILFKLISMVLIHAFFCSDLSWAAGGNLKSLSTHLAPPLKIVNSDFAKQIGGVVTVGRTERVIYSGNVSAEHKKLIAQAIEEEALFDEYFRQGKNIRISRLAAGKHSVNYVS
ncbi:MAG: hypothetical protein ABH952_09745 [Candidatus Omnitrophota bacterium]